MRYAHCLLIGLTLFAVLLAGCDKNNTTTNPPATHASGSYTGTIAGTNVNGSVTLNIPSGKTYAYASVKAIITVTGTLKLQGDTTGITLTGQYNTDNDSIYVWGGTFTFAGTYSNGLLQGTFTSTTGLSGAFVAQTGANTAVVIYYGTWASTSDTTHHGSFDMCAKGNALAGLLFIPPTSHIPFVGTITGDHIAIQPAALSAITVASGAFTSAGHDTATGTYDLTNYSSAAGSGTWQCIHPH